MAFDVRKFGVRTGSAILFVILLLGSVLYSYSSFTIFFLIVSMGGLFEFYRIAKKLGAKPHVGAGYIVGLLVYLSSLKWQLITGDTFQHPFLALAISPFILLAVAMFTRHVNPVQDALFTIGGVIYAVVPFSLMHGLVVINDHFPVYTPLLLLGVILLIWSNDTFAYLGGSFFGKHKMIERISPGKTWEGTAIGVVLAIASGLLIENWFQIGAKTWTVVMIIVPVLATIGDLVESMLKRQAGIKDSGMIMPGHGGFLDRFDSLIFTTPIVYVVVKLL